MSIEYDSYIMSPIWLVCRSCRGDSLTGTCSLTRHFVPRTNISSKELVEMRLQSTSPPVVRSNDPVGRNQWNSMPLMIPAQAFDRRDEIHRRDSFLPEKVYSRTNTNTTLDRGAQPFAVLSCSQLAWLDLYYPKQLTATATE